MINKKSILLLLILCASCVDIFADNTKSDIHRDSLIQVIRHSLYVSPQRCLDLTDSLEREGLFSIGEAALERVIVYNYLGQDRVALVYAEQASSDEEAMKDDNFAMDVTERLVSLNIELSDYESAIKYALSFIDATSKSGTMAKKAFSQYYYGTILYKTGKIQDGLNYYQKAFDFLEKAEKPRDLADLSFLYGQYISLMADEGRYSEAIDASKKREQILERMSKMKGIPDGYLDQQYGYLYSKAAFIYALAGNIKEADNFYRNFEKTSYSKTPMGMSYGLPYLNATKQFDKSINQCKILLQDEDTMSVSWTITASKLAEAYSSIGNHKEAEKLYKTMLNVEDELNTKENSSLVNEMATVYGIKERDKEILHQHDTIRYQRHLGFFLGAIILVLLLFIWYFIASNRELNIKNRKLYEQIQKPKTISSDNPTANSNNNPEFDSILERIISSKLFTNETFDRKEMAREMGTNDTYLYSYIKDISGLPVTSYINNLRLDYSIELLASIPQSGDKIEQIAYRSGFSSIRTFQRLFKTRYGITPSEYLKYRNS